MRPVRYSVGDVVEFDGVTYLVEGITESEIPDSERLRYEFASENGETVFAYVDLFDERADVTSSYSGVVAIDGEPVSDTAEADAFLATLTDDDIVAFAAALEPEDEDDE